MKKRILFVDDEPNVLQGLQRLLRPMADEWEMTFVPGGREALEAMTETPYDVVVSDMRMPGMDGAQLLSHVKELYPATVRVILSGHSEKNAILRSVGPTHQFLAKPCDPDALKDVIARACALRDLLSDAGLRNLASQLTSVPSLPETYAAIVEELQSPEASIRKVGEIVSRDVGMTAKILHLVNSAFFGLRCHVSDPAQAAGLLGIDTIKALVLSVHIFSRLDGARVEGFHLDALWNHSVVTGTLAKRIAASTGAARTICDHAFLAGLVHDAGKLVVAANLPDCYREVLSLSRAESLTVCEAERRLLGSTHAEVGAYLFGLWGLPDPIVEAVAFHHHPGQSPTQGFGPLAAAHIANAIDHEASGDPHAAAACRMDEAYVAALGLAERVPAWRAMHAEVLQEGGSR